VKAAQVREGLREYGDRLFAQVFLAHREAEYEYRQVRGQLSRVQIEIIGNDPMFQALHWETMRDPDLDKLLAIECVMRRRQDWRSVVPAKLAPSQRINVLLVTARPDEEKDLQYRVTSRPLLAAIENSQMPINLVLLRPGTYEALERHLADIPEGFYHIVHFDAHGGVITYELLQAYEKRDRMLLKGRYGGRSDLQPFGGERAFLFLETETKGMADPVETQELATLLNGKRIPICILDACQLAQNPAGESEDEAEGLGDSLGSRLMTAGMQMVVAMRYSILAEAAGQLMGQFYQALVNKRSLLEAVRLGRRELFNQKSRRASYNQQVDLEDWLLPVVYCNQPQAMTIELQPMLPQEEAAYWQQQAGQYRFSEPTYGFVGRDLEILKIEKSLLRRNVLLVQGMGGTGKTTLLNFLRQWWQKTNFVARTFYFGYDQKAWTLAQIMHEIGKAIYSTYEQAIFQAMPLEAQQQKLVATLRSGCIQTQLPYALILDNLESVTGQDLAIQNTLPPAEQQQICDFLSRLVGGKIYGVLGSRSSEDWLKRHTFRDNVYVLQGLDPESRSQLAEKILQQQVGDRTATIRQDPQFT
ncbi:MAG TPA: CHAT domain-containing protein, partial [Coleofasciculaceae cyanobacterium]